MESLRALTHEHNLKTYADLGEVFANWVHGKDCDPEAGALGLRQALEAYLAQGNKSGAPSFHGLLAELEAMRPDVDSALAAIDAGFAIAEETGEHYTDPYLHRLRGEFLLMQCPDDPVPAEEAFQTAIAIARGQGARGYALWPRTRSQSFINHPAVQTTRAPSSPLRSKAFRERRKCPRSQRRRRC